MVFRYLFFILFLCSFTTKELLATDIPKDFFLQIPTSANPGFVGLIRITDRKNGINEATWLYVKAALDYYRKEKPLCIILELDTPGGDLFAAGRISNALKSFDVEEKIPIVAYVNNWAISAGALLAYSCRYIIIADDASMGAATPIYESYDKMEIAPEKVNSVVRAEFANKAQLYGRNQDIAKAMVDPDVFLVSRGGNVLALRDESDMQNNPSEPYVILSPKGKLLTLTAKEMVDLGVANFVISSALLDLLEKSSLQVKQFEMSFQEKIISFFASPLVSSALLFVAIVCFYIEFSAPGVSIPGLIGGICLFFVIVGSYAQEAITWFEPLCLFAGVILIVLELFLFPTLGILLFFGGILALFGFLGILIPGFKEASLEPGAFSLFGSYILKRLGWLSGAFLLALMTSILLARFLSLRLFRLSGIVLSDPSPTFTESIPVHVNDEAIVISSLRPAGKILLTGIIYDAISQGAFIDKDDKVTVVEIRGNTIVVVRKKY